MDTATDSGYATVAQAAATAHVTPRTIWRHISAGNLPAVRRPGRQRVWIPTDALNAWVAGEPIQPAAEARR